MDISHLNSPFNESDAAASVDPLSRLAVEALLARVEREIGHDPAQASTDEWMRTTAHACRAELAERLNQSRRADRLAQAKRVHYLSMEFLMGRALANALTALKLDSAFRLATRRAGRQAGDVLEREPDAALGNGGLGRLAACFLDSMATLGLPSIGYGLRYQYGMFAQRIHDDQQVEEPDDWLRDGNPWELYRPELRFKVGFGGRVVADGPGRRWVPKEILHATAYDFIVPGHRTHRVALLRQWQATASCPIDFVALARGDYVAAHSAQRAAESINWVLYPDDSTAAGRELRLRQEFFLASASLQDLIGRHFHEYRRLDNLADKAAIHLNDTHSALAVPELLRLLIDEHGMSWDAALLQCQQAFSYTNHTLMPEALETWPVHMLEALLPRHLQIIFEINARFLAVVRQRIPNDQPLVERVSVVGENGDRHLRMASLAIVASHRVNGVSRLHSDLMVQTIFADFARIFPDRFCNVTNGVTPRRWLAQANPPLAALLDARLGTDTDWRTQLERLADLAPLATDNGLRGDILDAKRLNKERLSDLVRRDLGLQIDPASLFDVQVKRFHEYKRQLLNLLQVIARYQAMGDSPQAAWQPRTVFFAGKAASSYVMAKTIIRLIHDVARVVNSDSRVAGRLRVVFLPNYGVSLAESIIPAADLSQQISTAGAEASGTGNMKLALNGALTIGTWDGANIEMAQAIGREHLFIFGLRAEEVSQVRARGYDPRLHYENNTQLRRVIDAIAGGSFSPGEPDRYRPLVDALLHRDAYMLLADFAAYVQAQGEVDRLFGTPYAWADKAIRNIAGMGSFSVDRTVREYAQNIWNMPVSRGAGRPQPASARQPEPCD